MQLPCFKNTLQLFGASLLDHHFERAGQSDIPRGGANEHPEFTHHLLPAVHVDVPYAGGCGLDHKSHDLRRASFEQDLGEAPQHLGRLPCRLWVRQVKLGDFRAGDRPVVLESERDCAGGDYEIGEPERGV